MIKTLAEEILNLRPTYPVMIALSKVALSSSDLKKMEEEKSRGSEVVRDDSSCKQSGKLIA